MPSRRRHILKEYALNTWDKLLLLEYIFCSLTFESHGGYNSVTCKPETSKDFQNQLFSDLAEGEGCLSIERPHNTYRNSENYVLCSG